MCFNSRERERDLCQHLMKEVGDYLPYIATAETFKTKCKPLTVSHVSSCTHENTNVQVSLPVFYNHNVLYV